MKKSFICLLLIILFSFFMYNKIGAVTIITPDDKSYVDTPFIYVVGKLDNPKATHLTISVNDLKSPLINVKDPEYTMQFKDFFIIDIELDEGENLIGITLYADRKPLEEKKILVYYAKDSFSPLKNVKRLYFHKESKEKECKDCHKIEKETCVECHKNLVAKKYVHGPAGSGDCDVCHIMNEKNEVKYKVKSSYKELCKECHDNLAPQNFVSMHGPFAVGECVACHNLHSSDFKHQLKGEINDLCKNCHADFKDKNVPHVVAKHPLSGKKDPSRPGNMLGCTSCHNPHGEKSPFFFVQGIMNRMEICKICHKK